MPIIKVPQQPDDSLFYGYFPATEREVSYANVRSYREVSTTMLDRLLEIQYQMKILSDEVMALTEKLQPPKRERPSRRKR